MASERPTTAGGHPVRGLRTRAVFALVAIALIAVLSHLASQGALADQDDAALMINRAGRMRMQSQRIALLAGALPNASQVESQAYRAELELIRADHQDAWEAIQSYAAELRDRDGRERVLRELDAARVPLLGIWATVDEAQQEPATWGARAPKLLALANVFLPPMDRAVIAIDEYATGSLERIKALNVLLLWGGLAALVFVGIGVLLPATRRIEALITEVEAKNRQLGERLERSQRFAGGMAHLFNNLIFQIQGCAELLQRTPDDATLIESQLHSCKRATMITSQLLAYAGQGTLHFRDVELGALVTETIAQLPANLHPEQVQVELLASPHVDGDGERLARAFEALLVNALEAVAELPSGEGRVRVGLSVRELNGGHRTSAPYDVRLLPGHYAVLSVDDNGHGLPPELADHVFDPFATTKFLGRGLGMSAALGIAHAHGGGIDVRSEGGLHVELLVPLGAGVDDW